MTNTYTNMDFIVEKKINYKKITGNLSIKDETVYGIKHLMQSINIDNRPESLKDTVLRVSLLNL